MADPGDLAMQLLRPTIARLSAPLALRPTAPQPRRAFASIPDPAPPNAADEKVSPHSPYFEPVPARA